MSAQNMVATQNKLAKEKQQADKAADTAAAAAPVSEGKVRVRLLRPCYDADGVLHPAGITELDAKSVPKSAETLAKGKEAEEADED